jgi:large subunit ribosomal protein L19
MDTIQSFSAEFSSKDFSHIRPGLTLKVYQKIKEGAKTRTQIFEGLVIATKHGRGVNATMTVRKISNGIGVERIFPLHLPTIEKIEVVKASKVRRAKLYYLRSKTARETRRKTKILTIKGTPKTQGTPTAEVSE